MDERRLKLRQLALDMLWEHGLRDAGKKACVAKIRYGLEVFKDASDFWQIGRIR